MDFGTLAGCVLLVCIVACILRSRSCRRVLCVGACIAMGLMAVWVFLARATSGPRRGPRQAVVVEMQNLQMTAANHPTRTLEAGREVRVDGSPNTVVVDQAEGEPVWPFHKSRAADVYPTRDRAIAALAALSAKELREGLARTTPVMVATQNDDRLRLEIIQALDLEAPELEAEPARVPNLGKLVRPAREKKVDVEQVAETFATEIVAAVAVQLQELLTLDPERIARGAMQTARRVLSADSPHVLEVSEHARENEGTFSARLSYTTLVGQRIERKRFVLAYGDRPWVVAAHSPGKSESASYVGRSAWEPTRKAALRAARAGAWQQLGIDVQNRVSGRKLSAVERVMLRGGRLDRHVQRIVGRPWGPQQEFVQIIQSEQGPLYRAAVHMTGVNVLQTAQQVVDRAQMTHETMRMRVLGLLLLVALTYGGYRILDAGTRGHFTWRWRVLSVAAFFAVAALALLFVG